MGPGGEVQDGDVNVEHLNDRTDHDDDGTHHHHYRTVDHFDDTVVVHHHPNRDDNYNWNGHKHIYDIDGSKPCALDDCAYRTHDTGSYAR